MKRLCALGLGLIFLFYGCASIVSKSDYPVSLYTTPSGATVRIFDSKNGHEVYVGKTPTTVTLSAKAGYFSPATYNVDFVLPNGIKKTITLTAKLDGWYIGNVLFGSFVGLLIVDPLTGAMWKLPSHVHTTLSSDVSLIYNGKKLSFTMLHNVPDELRSNMIPIKD